MLSQSVILVRRHIQAWRNSGEILSSVQASGNHLSKGQRNRDLGSVQDSQQDREGILFKQRNIHYFLEEKGDHAYQGDCAAQREFI